jgi:hypothetical protein
MSARTRKIKLELSVSEAVALYYAGGRCVTTSYAHLDKTTSRPPVSGNRKTDRLILKSLELLANAIRKGTSGYATAIAVRGHPESYAKEERAGLRSHRQSRNNALWHPNFFTPD